MNNWQIYWFYSEIVFIFGQLDESNNFSQKELDKETADKAFSLLQKAFRNLYNQPNWEQSIEACSEVITYSTKILSSEFLKF